MTLRTTWKCGRKNLFIRFRNGQASSHRVSAGFDVKSYQMWTFHTNYTTVQQFDDSDTNSPPVLTYSDTVPLPQQWRQFCHLCAAVIRMVGFPA
jgi:hypothetical protein